MNGWIDECSFLVLTVNFHETVSDLFECSDSDGFVIYVRSCFSVFGLGTSENNVSGVFITESVLLEDVIDRMVFLNFEHGCDFSCIASESDELTVSSSAECE